MRTRSSPSHFYDILTARTLRMIEDQGPLEDSEAMREAFRKQSGREARLLERARLLSKRIKLNDEMERWREMAFFVWIGLAVLVFLMAYGIAAALLGEGRSLNAVLAFVGVLGMHALTLLLWLFGAALSGLASSSLGQASFGNLFLRLMAWMPIDRGPYSLTLARSASELFRHSRLTPWAFGFISHSIWAASFILVLIALWFGFSFREYRLTWETTILHADFFIRFVQLSGWLPSLLGFPVPDTSTLLKPDAAGSDQRSWALWLIGCTFVYGLLVRLVLAGFCWIKWRTGKRNVKLDTSDPYFRKILARFDQMETSAIIDREQRPDLNEGSRNGQKIGAHVSFPALIGFELPDEFNWPPQNLDLPPSLQLNENISGSSQERKSILEKLAHFHPSRLLIACNPSSTPDRGTERFLREAILSVGQCAILLMARVQPSDQDMKRWREWLVDTNMRGIMIFSDPAQAGQWLSKAYEDT